MLFLAESHNTGDITQYLEAETVRIGELMRAGIIGTVLLKADQPGAFLLVRSARLGVRARHRRKPAAGRPRAHQR